MKLTVKDIRVTIRGRRKPASDQRPPVLAIIADAPKRDALRVALEPLGWRFVFTDSAATGMEQQQHERYPVILFDRDSAGEDWRDAIRALSAGAPRPSVILMSCHTDRNLWEELVRLGGYDIVRSPIRAESVAQTLAAGWSLWRNQHRLRRRAAAAKPESESYPTTPLRTA